MKRKPNIAIVGASGLVGMTMIKVLEESDIEIENLYLFASKRSAGKILKFRNNDYLIKELDPSFVNYNIDLALFATSKEISNKYIPLFKDANIYCIDNSSAFRNDNSIPLIAFGVNDYLINKNTKIIANPNCSTIQAVLALEYIHKKYIIKRIIYNTYQAVSGSGHLGVLDLVNGVEGKPNMFYNKQIAFNLIPQIGEIGLDGYSTEELKMINETKRILESNDIMVTASCVRVPVVNSHSININVECNNEIDINDLVNELKKNDFLQIYEDDYPTPRLVSGSDKVHIGRIRIDRSVKNGLNLWTVADNLRVGAATNAVRILNKLWKEIESVI